MNCELCDTKAFKYACPRCNIKYCSLDCYRSENHAQCSEAFYKECVVNELQQQQGNTDDKKSVLEILQRLNEHKGNWPQRELATRRIGHKENELKGIEPQDEEDWTDQDSDDDTGDEGDLADRLAEVDLNNADAIWERLTDEEKQEFKSIVYNGEIEKIVQPTEPWWKLQLEVKPVHDIEADEAKVKEILKSCPTVKSDIKDFKKISTKSPAPLIVYNIANVVGAFTYIFRYYNGDHMSYALEATDNLIKILDGDGETFQILRKILDSKNITINRKSSTAKPNNEANRNQNNNSNPVPTNTSNGSQCPYCRRVYADATAVNRHIKKYCLKEKRFGCIFCQYRSKRKDHIVRHSIRVHDAQLRQKISSGEFAVPSDAVLKDGKLCEPEGSTNESATINDSDFSMDFSALYPEITDDAINDDDDEPLPIKTELIESDDD